MQKLNVIIPCHNHGEYLYRAVESAIHQCDRVIIVNDASRDNTSNVIDNLKSQYPDKLESVETHNVCPIGAAAARNLAIAHGGDGLYLPLDADDYLEQGVCNILVTNYQPNTFVYGNWCELREHNNRVIIKPPAISMIDKKNIGYGTYLFSYRSWLGARGYDCRMNHGGEHWGFMMALLYRAKSKPVYVDTNVFYYDRTTNRRHKQAMEHFKSIQRLVGDVKYGR